MLVLLTLALSAVAADWPAFRGPDGAGRAPDAELPTQWSSTTNVRWKQPLAGEGWSSPVVAGERIYLTAAVPAPAESKPDYSLRLWCGDARTGQPLWDTEIFREPGEKSEPIHSKNSHASPTPLVAGDRIFVHFGHEGTACVDKSGKVLWRNQELRYAPVHGNGGTPILYENALIFSCDGREEPFIAALDAASGKQLWTTPRVTDATKKFSFSTPLLITVEGQPQVVSPGSNAVCAYDPRTGRELWRVRYDGYSVIPKPVFAHGLLYVCTGYNTPSLLAIRPGGTGDLTETHIAWKATRGVPHTPSLLVVGDELYMVSDRGIASCLDARTGEVHWQERLGGNYSASPLYASGKVYFQSEEGEGVAVKAGRTFEVLARNPLQERTLASYAVTGNALLIRSDKHLYRIEATPAR